MGAVAETIVEAPFKAVESVGKSVGNAVEDVGNFVNKEVIQPVAKAVEKTVQAAIDDPIGTAVKIAAISTGNPYLIAAANTGVALAHGASMDDALKAGATAAAFSYVAEGVADYVKPEYSEYFADSPNLAAAATNATASVAATAAVGGDPLEALIMSGAGSAADVIANKIPGYDTLSKNEQRALKTTIAYELQGKDPSQALVNQAVQVGVNYVKNAPMDLAGQNIVPKSANTPSAASQSDVDAMIDGTYFDEKPTVEDLANVGVDLKPFTVDYGLSTGKDPLGLKPSAQPEVFNPDGSVNYDITSSYDPLGLQLPESPNINSMGGGQGLTAPAFGSDTGTVTESGVYDPNDPTLTGSSVIPYRPSYAPSTPDKKQPAGKTPTGQVTGQFGDYSTNLDALAAYLSGSMNAKPSERDSGVVKSTPELDLGQPLDISFFDQLLEQQKEAAKNKSGVVKIASGGYMDTFFPQQPVSIDEILRILEGKYHG
jgi:hypothetical protein